MKGRPISCGKLLAVSQMAASILFTTACFTIVADDQPRSERGAGATMQRADDTGSPVMPPEHRLFNLKVGDAHVSTETVPVVNGRVTVSPPPEFPGNRYSKGATVTLAATPDEGYGLLEWTGDCSSVSGDVCTLAMDIDKTVNVTFQPLPVSETLEVPSAASTSQ